MWPWCQRALAEAEWRWWACRVRDETWNRQPISYGMDWLRFGGFLNWGSPMVGLVQGKSHLEMDDGNIHTKLHVLSAEPLACASGTSGLAWSPKSLRPSAIRWDLSGRCGHVTRWQQRHVKTDCKISHPNFGYPRYLTHLYPTAVSVGGFEDDWLGIEVTVWRIVAKVWSFSRVTFHYDMNSGPSAHEKKYNARSDFFLVLGCIWMFSWLMSLFYGSPKDSWV